MYKCNNCGHAFETAESYAESRPFGAEAFSCCPACGSTDYEEAHKCKISGEYITDDEEDEIYE